MSELPNINHLSYEETIYLLETLEIKRQQLYPEYAARKQSEYLSRREKAERKQLEFREDILPRIKTYLIKHLIPNKSIIKVKGARDGKGIRLFLGFNGKDEYMRLECRQIHRHSELLYTPRCNNPIRTYKEEVGQITEHQLDKVTHIEVGGEMIRVQNFI